MSYHLDQKLCEVSDKYCCYRQMLLDKFNSEEYLISIGNLRK